MSGDPLGFLPNPSQPSTIVKVVGTARDDMNGQLGVVVQYQQDRGRYLVQNATTQQLMALKPENLVKASTMESARAQVQLLQNNPQVQQKLREVYAKVKRALHPIPPKYAAGALVLLWFALIYFVGFSKTIMVSSVIMLLLMVVAPDLLEGASAKTMRTNFPRRCREAIETNIPFLQGRVSNKVAVVIVVGMVALAILSLFSGAIASKGAAGPPPQHPTVGDRAVNMPHLKALKEEYYKMGFEDAKNGLEFGTSLNVESVPRDLSSPSTDIDGNDAKMEYEFDDYPMAPPPERKGFGFGSAMSAFFLFRTASELGRDAGGGGWSFQRMMANARTLEPWKLGMVGFSLYNLVRSLI